MNHRTFKYLELAFVIVMAVVFIVQNHSVPTEADLVQNKLTASDAAADDQYGWTVDITDNGNNTGIVGAWKKNGEAGAAYIIEESAPNVWSEVKPIIGTDTAAGDNFGTSVGIDGNYAIIGAPWNDDGGDKSGSAYIFERDLGGADFWGERVKLTASDAAAYDVFGYSVAISGDYAVVGARGETGNIGAAYIFYKDSDGAGGTLVDNWGQIKK